MDSTSTLAAVDILWPVKFGEFEANKSGPHLKKV
jgi:hypothetical protein